MGRAVMIRPLRFASLSYVMLTRNPFLVYLLHVIFFASRDKRKHEGAATRQRVLIETASIAGGVTMAVILVFIVCITVYLYYQRRKDKTYFDVPDEPKLFFCDRKKTPNQLPHPVLRQSDLERGRGVHMCDNSRRSSS
ncbi:hypothetical protein V5799_031640 [Amblyomma americanum]|uniref:Uncharacterized protein n=1 Tax=Amblyomma americanum TaxID=6943 RepID=A0AAQ4DTG2_AMBAM